MEKYCPKCGYKSDFKFCPNCGFKLEDIHLPEEHPRPETVQSARYSDADLKRLFVENYAAYKKMVEQQEALHHSTQSPTAENLAEAVRSVPAVPEDMQTPPLAENVESSISEIDADKLFMQILSEMEHQESQPAQAAAPDVSVNQMYFSPDRGVEQTFPQMKFPYWPITNILPDKYEEKKRWLASNYIPMTLLKINRVGGIIGAILSFLVFLATASFIYSSPDIVYGSDSDVLLTINLIFQFLFTLFYSFEAYYFYKLKSAGYTLFLINIFISTPISLFQRLPVEYTLYDLLIVSLSSAITMIPLYIVFIVYYEKRRFIFIPTAEKPDIKLKQGMYAKLVATPYIKKRILIIFSIYTAIFVGTVGLCILAAS